MMSSRQRDPGPTVFGWDEEPSDERPSEFAQSTQLGPASGYYRGGRAHAPRARRRSGVSGWIIVLLFVLLLIAVVGAGLKWIVPMLHR
jgi:hypothetical protein